MGIFVRTIGICVLLLFISLPTSAWAQEDDTLLHPQTLTWRASEVVSTCNMVDGNGNNWFELDFDSSAWAEVTLPEHGTIGYNQDRFYSADLVLTQVQPTVIRFSSDDGSWIYVNGVLVAHGGGDCHQSGCAGNPTVSPPCGGNAPVELNIASHLRAGNNRIAAHVSNSGICCDSYFDLQVLIQTASAQDSQPEADSANLAFNLAQLVVSLEEAGRQCAPMADPRFRIGCMLLNVAAVDTQAVVETIQDLPGYFRGVRSFAEDIWEITRFIYGPHRCLLNVSVAGLRGSWQGTASQYDYGSYPMIFEIQTTTPTGSFSGSLRWPTLRDSITNMTGEIICRDRDSSEPERWRVVEERAGTTGLWLRFTETSLIQGSGIVLGVQYYALLRNDGTIEGVWFSPHVGHRLNGDYSLSRGS